MQATFAYEDPLSRASGQLANATLKTQAKVVFRDMGRNMWTSGRGFAKVGALYAGTECVIEGVSAPGAASSRADVDSIEQRTTLPTLYPLALSLGLSSRVTLAPWRWSVVVRHSQHSHTL